jgi:hypothetical protein
MGADASVKVWNVNDIALVAFGIPITKGPGKTGMAEGAFLEIEQDGDDFAVKKGIDGSAVIFAKNEPLTMVHVHVMSTSEANGVLSTMRQTAVSSGGTDGIGTLLAKDTQGASVFEAMACIVAGPPKLAINGEPGENVWPIICLGTTRVDGGR